MHATPELLWRLHSSFWQTVLDVLALLTLCSLLLVYQYGVWLALSAGLLVLAIYAVWYGKQDPVVGLQRLGVTDESASIPHWRLIHRSGHTRMVRWRAGSVRRSHLLILRYSVWPWQGLVLRRCNFDSEQHFKALQRVLYSEL
ncbi:hypothetical protein [Oceanobacter sp. 3_MG-2023]|uniref:hypothetical protein n=1 Tax=Oceanobacter sp. 3_MG-2023 TaxID=3062622 RepID=UPI0027357E49|nr:hypothetical protein [Oceanobacter sp. 3_MG-2023]MDP2506809.1 hypothetical protein [Oceanobacter sp. 3_MG-2023]